MIYVHFVARKWADFGSVDSNVRKKKRTDK